MNSCPMCSKKLNENFEYCNECGSKVDGGMMGNFRTNFLNVFHFNNEYMYLFSVNGRQIVLKADTIDDLKELVRLNKFPWMEIENNNLSCEGSNIDV